MGITGRGSCFFERSELQAAKTAANNSKAEICFFIIGKVWVMQYMQKQNKLTNRQVLKILKMKFVTT
jgi:hypothetical protein